MILFDVIMHLISPILDISVFPPNVSCSSSPVSLKNESFVFNNVDRVRIKAKLTNSSLQNLFLTRNCGDVSIVRINL